MVAAVVTAEAEVVAIWVAAVAEASTAVVAAMAADTMAAPEVTAAGLTEVRTVAAVTAAVDMAGADTPDADTAVPLAPVAQLQPGLGLRKAMAPDGLAVPPETSHLTQLPRMEIGTLLVAPAAQL
jgi:hypothetical protein